MSRKNIIVTGAASSIGLACVRRLLDAGDIVAALDIATTNLEEAYVADERVIREQLDAGSPESCRKAVTAAANRLGGFDAIIHCAAAWTGTPWDRSDADEWDRILAINLRGSFLIAQAATEKLIERGKSSMRLPHAPLGRIRQPEDIADVACFLASDAARFMSGEVVEVNGGFYFD